MSAGMKLVAIIQAGATKRELKQQIARLSSIEQRDRITEMVMDVYERIEMLSPDELCIIAHSIDEVLA